MGFFRHPAQDGGMKLAMLFLLPILSGTAGTITLTGVDLARGGNARFLVNGTEETDFAGVILAAYNGGPTQQMFCVDLFTSISLTTYSSEPRAPASNKELRTAYLYVNYLAGVSSIAQGQALQLAIWDIIHDGGDGINAGSIRRSSNTSNTVANAWTSYLSASLGQSSTAASIYINFNGSTPAQTLIGAFQPTATPGVPEPATFLLVGGAMTGLSLYRRRKP